MYHQDQVRKVRFLEDKVHTLMGRNRDYRSQYFKESYASKYLYKYKESIDEVLHKRD